MSLSSFVELPGVRTLLDGLVPPFERKLADSILVSPVAGQRGLVGTAFDYATRLILKRLNPHARCERWVAEESCEVGTAYGETARRIVDEAKEFIDAGAPQEPIATATWGQAAFHGVRLAKLDEYYRLQQANPAPELVEEDVLGEVTDLVRRVPFNQLSRPKRMALNPTFGRWSVLVGGADADIIRGDLLIDLKTTAKGFLERAHIRQTIGYLILARRACVRDKTLPKPRRVGIYFARFQYLWVSPRITEHPRYLEIARDFVGLARGASP